MVDQFHHSNIICRSNFCSNLEHSAGVAAGVAAMQPAMESDSNTRTRSGRRSTMTATTLELLGTGANLAEDVSMSDRTAQEAPRPNAALNAWLAQRPQLPVAAPAA